MGVQRASASCSQCPPLQVCTACTPNREYVRVFDVTERTALHRHQTGRVCHKCGAQLRDTIVHFGERGTLGQPLNWEAATQAASKADTILCLGSSLKVHSRHCGWAGSSLPAASYSLVPWLCGLCPSVPAGSEEIPTPLVHDQAPQPAAQALHCELAGNSALRAAS